MHSAGGLAGSGAQSGLILLWFFDLLDGAGLDWEAQEDEGIEATFAAGSGGPLVVPLHLLPPAGTCTVWLAFTNRGGGASLLMESCFRRFGGARPGCKRRDSGGRAVGGKLNLVAGRKGFYRGAPLQTFHEAVHPSR